MLHYVATNGNDAAPGSSSQPWRTIRHAADAVGPGDTVIVLAGDYPERVFINRPGASGAPITFKAQGKVTMRGFTVKTDHIALIGFDISNTDDHWENGWGIFLEGSHCTIEDNYVHYATRGGINLYSAPGSYASTSHCVVRNNRLYRNALAGIDVYGRDNLIEGNEIWGTIQYHPGWSDPPGWVDADGIRFFGSGHTIRKNYIHDITLQDPENVDPHIDCFQTWSDTFHERAQDITFEQNYCDNPHRSTSAFMLQGARNLIIRNNIIHAFGGVNTGDGGNSDLTIVNNVFVGDLSFPIDRHPVGIALVDAPNVVIKNNVFYDLPAQVIWVTGASEQGLDVGHNLTYRSDGEQPWGLPYPGDLWQVDPRFVDAFNGNYQPRPDSPLIDTGVSLSTVVNDYKGTPRPLGDRYDIGIFEMAP